MLKNKRTVFVHAIDPQTGQFIVVRCKTVQSFSDTDFITVDFPDHHHETRLIDQVWLSKQEAIDALNNAEIFTPYIEPKKPRKRRKINRGR